MEDLGGFRDVSLYKHDTHAITSVSKACIHKVHISPPTPPCRCRVGPASRCLMDGPEPCPYWGR